MHVVPIRKQAASLPTYLRTYGGVVRSVCVLSERGGRRFGALFVSLTPCVRASASLRAFRLVVLVGWSVGSKARLFVFRAALRQGSCLCSLLEYPRAVLFRLLSPFGSGLVDRFVSLRRAAELVGFCCLGISTGVLCMYVPRCALGGARSLFAGRSKPGANGCCCSLAFPAGR